MADQPHILIVAHRGLHGPASGHVENTLPAMTAAWQAGISWCECDVHFSADGQAVVIHDKTVDRTTAGHGRVAGMAAVALATLGVPRLDDLIAAMPAGARLIVEPKAGVRADWLVRLASSPRAGDLLVHTFDLADLPAIASAGLAVAAVVDKPARMAAALASTAAGVHVEQAMVDAELVDRIHRAAKRVGVWTVNEIAAMGRMRELGVDYLITDEPLLAMKTLRSK